MAEIAYNLLIIETPHNDHFYWFKVGGRASRSSRFHDGVVGQKGVEVAIFSATQLTAQSASAGHRWLV